MRLENQSLAAVAIIAATIATGCSGNKENSSDTEVTTDTAANVDVRGKWYIENIVFSDSDYIRPEEAVPGIQQYFVFEDSTYSIRTNCNSICGPYSVKGDSITLGDGAMTEMACDNMDTEDALRRILPDIATIDVQNDSVIRLNGATPAECIILRK